MGWRIEYQGHTLDESEVTIGHMTMVEQLLGIESSWDTANPMQSPATLAAWVALVLAHGSKEPIDTVMLFVTTRPVAELVAAVTTNGEVT